MEYEKLIRQLHLEMRSLSIEFAKVKETFYDSIIKNVDLFNDWELQQMHLYLTNLRQNEYAEVQKIYKMPPKPECWKNYALFGFEGLTEQILMAKAAPKLRKKIIEHFKPIRKIRRKKEKDVEASIPESNVPASDVE